MTKPKSSCWWQLGYARTCTASLHPWGLMAVSRRQAVDVPRSTLQDVTDRDAVIADMRQQLAVAQAAAAAAASLLPAVQSGQLSDATAVQVGAAT